MSGRYRIHWKSIITEREGQGTALFPKYQAELIRDGLNEQNQGLLIHWIEEETEKEETPCVQPA